MMQGRTLNVVGALNDMGHVMRRHWSCGVIWWELRGHGGSCGWGDIASVVGMTRRMLWVGGRWEKNGHFLKLPEIVRN